MHVLKSTPASTKSHHPWLLEAKSNPRNQIGPSSPLANITIVSFSSSTPSATFPPSLPLPSSLFLLPLDLVGSYGWHLGNIHAGFSFEWGSLRRWTVTRNLQLKSPSRRGPRTLPQARTTLKRLCDKTTDHAFLPKAWDLIPVICDLPFDVD